MRLSGLKCNALPHSCSSPPCLLPILLQCYDSGKADEHIAQTGEHHQFVRLSEIQTPETVTCVCCATEHAMVLGYMQVGGQGVAKCGKVCTDQRGCGSIAVVQMWDVLQHSDTDEVLAG